MGQQIRHHQQIRSLFGLWKQTVYFAECRNACNHLRILSHTQSTVDVKRDLFGSGNFDFPWLLQWLCDDNGAATFAFVYTHLAIVLRIVILPELGGKRSRIVKNNSRLSCLDFQLCCSYPHKHEFTVVWYFLSNRLGTQIWTTFWISVLL